MSFIWRLFRSEKPPDDESVLAALARDIQRRQTLLSEIRARERTATALVTLYTLAAWLAYVAVWYFGFVSGGHGRRVGGVERALRALPVFVGPILILFIRRIVQIWYARKGNAEDKTLQTLLKAQRAKVEEIKKKTNFYETRELLSRYDREGSSPPGGAGGPGSVSSPNTPQRGGQGTPQRPNGNGKAGPRPSAINPSAGPRAPFRPQQQGQQQQPRPRGWFDKLADVLVGPDDGPQIALEKQKFALICGKCFAHNGLVPEVVWGEAQYTCPKCGHFNPSARSKGLLPGGGAGSRIAAPGLSSPGLSSPGPSPSTLSTAGLSSPAGPGSRIGPTSPLSATPLSAMPMDVDSDGPDTPARK